MMEYIKAQNKTNATIVNNAFSTDELHRFSKADFNPWIGNWKIHPFQDGNGRTGRMILFIKTYIYSSYLKSGEVNSFIFCFVFCYWLKIKHKVYLLCKIIPKGK